MLAEQAVRPGGNAEGTIQIAADRTWLIAYPAGVADDQKHIFAISGALANFGDVVSEASAKAAAIGDVDTADLFAQVSCGIDLLFCFVEWRLFDPVAGCRFARISVMKALLTPRACRPAASGWY